ncbi:MAG TPA: hypothetical protein VFU86_05545 [Terriglobales bacterium]|nr:hypothetical protein [Terriglobales bacterium]
MRRLTFTLILFAFILLPFRLLSVAQQHENTGSTLDTKALLDRIDQLEKRVQELEANKDKNVATPDKYVEAAAASTPEASAATDHSPSTIVSKAVEAKTGLQIRAFGQVSVLGHDMPGQRAAFNNGNFTLLLTSRLSDKLSAVAEIVFPQKGFSRPEFEIDLERALIRYEHNDYFRIDAGRYYTSIGYYNTAFYNADWAQTTFRRPIVATFQDLGGPMPMQRTGVSLSGRVPSGKLGLHYVAEVGGGDIVRGDAFGLGYEFPIQARPGFNLAVFARPRAISGLQVGGSFYHDSESPILGMSGNPLVRQNIYSAYAVYVTPKWEVLNEAYLIHHGFQGVRDFNIPAFYTQISRRLTPAWRPYFRYSYVNGGQHDPMLPDVNGKVTGIETGARYNLSEWVALKFEYARMNIGHRKMNINFGGTQLAFTF